MGEEDLLQLGQALIIPVAVPEAEADANINEVATTEEVEPAESAADGIDTAETAATNSAAVISENEQPEANTEAEVETAAEASPSSPS